MDWLEAHRVKLDCCNKTFECMDEEGNPRALKGIPNVIEVEGKIVEKSVSVLIESVSTHSYITPRIVEIYSFKKFKRNKSWLVQLAT